MSGHPKQVVIDSGKAFVACMEGTLDIVNLAESERTASIRLHGMPVDVIVDAKAGLAWVSSMQAKPWRRGRVHKIDLNRREVVAVAELRSGWAKGISVRPGSREIWVATWLAGSIEVIDIDSMEALADFPLGIAPRGIAFDNEGVSCFATDYYGRTVARVNAIDLKVEDVYRMPYRGLAYKGTPRDILVGGGNSVTISNMGRGAVHRFIAERGGTCSEITTVPVGARPATLRHSANGDIWCACHGDAELWRLAAADLRPLERWRLPAPAYGVDLDETGRIAAGIFDEATLIIAETGEEARDGQSDS